VNYLEVQEIDTQTTGAGVFTANAQTDGLTVGGVFLPLNQFHFHSPSEHTINGAHYPLEMHMVHKLFTSDGTVTGTVVAANATGAKMAQAAVIGIMFAYECVCIFTTCFLPLLSNSAAPAQPCRQQRHFHGQDFSGVQRPGGRWCGRERLL
jgi:hypothetical protein